MTTDTKTLRETVNEVIGEQTAKSATDVSSKQGIGQSQSGETQSGGKPEYVGGVDISDIPEQDRPRIKAKLEEKLKFLEKGYQPKFQEVAKLKKSLEWLSEQGLSPEEAEATLMKHVAAKKDPTSNEKKETLKTLDKLIADSPYEQKEALQNMRKIILEETNTTALKSEIAELQKAVKYLSNKDMTVGQREVEADLSTLEAKFGKELINEYRDKVLAEWAKYPNSKAKDILKYVVPDDDYEQALLSRNNRKTEKLNAVTNTSSGATSSTATLNVRKTSMKDLLTSVIKNKG